METQKRQAFDTGLFSAIDHVEEQKEMLWSAWSEKRDFECALRLVIQDVEALKAARPELNVSIPYQLGKLDGYTELFERLYRSESRVSAITEAVASTITDDSALQTSKVCQILLSLYHRAGQCHGELAGAVGSSSNSLTNMMKKVLLSGAVESVRSGRNTRYYLTEAGKKYCERCLIKEEASFLGMIQEAARKGTGEALASLAGSGAANAGVPLDRPFIPMVNNEFYNMTMEARSVVMMGRAMVVELVAGIENAETEPALDGRGSVPEYWMNMGVLENAR